jgi:agmatinase
MTHSTSKAAKIAQFDPNASSQHNDRLFGLPFNFEESAVAILPVPWEVTVSHRSGTSLGPQAVFDASFQVDLYDENIENAWHYGIYMMEISRHWLQKNNRLRMRSMEIIRYLEKGGNLPNEGQMNWAIQDINNASKELEKWVFEQTHNLINHGKLVGILGGDHSAPLGFLKALANKHGQYGILQIDAHADLRKHYEGFEQSHASIMYNALQIENINKLVQIGVRDYCKEERERITQHPDRIICLTDQFIKNNTYHGKTWAKQCDEIINHLPEKVYVSFDIDGLDPKLCPHTGTPVPGGFDLPQVMFLVRKLVESGKQIIGFDLCEIAPGPDDWDGNVGARILYQLSNWMVKSQI